MFPLGIPPAIWLDSGLADHNGAGSSRAPAGTASRSTKHSVSYPSSPNSQEEGSPHTRRSTIVITGYPIRPYLFDIVAKVSPLN